MHVKNTLKSALQNKQKNISLQDHQNKTV